MSPEVQAWTPREMQSREEILAELETAAASCRAHLEATSDDDFDRTWTMKAGDQVAMQEKKYLVFRRQVMNHWCTTGRSWACFCVCWTFRCLACTDLRRTKAADWASDFRGSRLR